MTGTDVSNAASQPAFARFASCLQNRLRVRLEKNSFRRQLLKFVAGSFLLTTSVAVRAAIVGPYSPDEHTLHLWHFDEPSVPVIDSGIAGTNLTVLSGGATLGNVSTPGFGNALSTAASSGAYLAARTLVNGAGDEIQFTYADAVTGAFTYEAIVRLDFNPATFTSPNPLYIICAENDASPAGAHRPWQFSILPPGSVGGSTFRLRFYNSTGNASYIFELPADGPDSLAQGNWYHVAASYDGSVAGGNLRANWTLLDDQRVQANEIGSVVMNDLTPLATGNVDFSIGNVGRTTPNGGFPGLIDEVRLSSVARLPTEMMFTTTNVVILTPPQTQTIAAGQPLNLSVMAAGIGPLNYQWRYNGEIIPLATQRVHHIPAVQISDWGEYDVIVSNSVSSATSAVATVNVASSEPIALRIEIAGSNIFLAWPVSTIKWKVQSAAELLSVASWQTLTNSVAMVGNESVMSLQDDDAQKIFRLVATLAPPPTNAVFPIEWENFQAGIPADTNSQLVVSILRNACRYAMTTWWTNHYAAQDAAEYLSLGGTGEVQVRRPAMEAYGLAVALQTGAYDAAHAGVSENEARQRTLKLVRSVAFRHLSNQPGGWGNVWQSAHWAALTGTAGWLLWNDFSETDREYIRRMVEYEANRFTNYSVPYYKNRAGTVIFSGDTKTEENAWNASVIHLALCMMPAHSNAPIWWNKAVELTLSVHARPSDVNRTNIFHGRSLASWLNGSNANEDSTVINHSIVHPDYMVAGLGEFQPALVYLLANRSVPAASFFNLDLMYDALVDLQFVAGTTPYPVGGAIRSPGGFIYVRDEHNAPTQGIYFPHGNDWGTSRRMHFATLDATMAAFGLDAEASISAASWELQHNLTVLNMQARFSDGRTYGASSEDSYSLREEWVCNYAAKSLLTKWLVHQKPVSISNDAEW